MFPEDKNLHSLSRVWPFGLEKVGPGIWDSKKALSIQPHLKVFMDLHSSKCIEWFMLCTYMKKIYTVYKTIIIWNRQQQFPLFRLLFIAFCCAKLGRALPAKNVLLVFVFLHSISRIPYPEVVLICIQMNLTLILEMTDKYFPWSVLFARWMYQSGEPRELLETCFSAQTAALGCLLLHQHSRPIWLLWNCEVLLFSKSSTSHPAENTLPSRLESQPACHVEMRWDETGWDLRTWDYIK